MGICVMGLHDWTSDCETCARCGRTRSDAHDWSRDCETCARCHMTRVGLEIHDWTEDPVICARCQKSRFDALVACLSKGSHAQRAAAIRELRDEYPAKSVESLINALDQATVIEMVVVAAALLHIGDTRAIQPIASKLETACAHYTGTQFTSGVAMALVGFGQPALPCLRELLGQKDKRVTRAIVHARRTWKEIGKEQALRAVAKKDDGLYRAAMEILENAKKVEVLGS